MIRFLIDVNLPYRIDLWNEPRFIHVRQLNDEWSDSQVWEFAKENRLTIITKDTDFSNRIITAEPPPKVIHMKIGNMRLTDFWHFIQFNWGEIERTSKSHKLVVVYRDKIFGID